MVRVAQSSSTKTVGVLALQGAFNIHKEVLSQLDVATYEVKTPQDLTQIDALVMPGGESTTMSQLLESSELFEPIKKMIHEGMPVFGTCAGMILLSKNIIDGRDDQISFEAIDIEVQRNAYGRQIDSFEADIKIDKIVGTFHAVFIRAPRISRAGSGVEVLSRFGDDIILAKQKNILVASFHPELAHDNRIHELFVKEI